jgi:multisubunit Na+/H+ antiporter MnhG subunit
VSPTLKYTLGRIGLFLAVFLVLWPVDLNILVKLMIAVVFSAALAYFVLRGWRDQVAGRLSTAADRRKADRERLRSALAGEDQKAPPEERDDAEGGPAKS